MQSLDLEPYLALSPSHELLEFHSRVPDTTSLPVPLPDFMAERGEIGVTFFCVILRLL
jgi:hypothetical protein